MVGYGKFCDSYFTNSSFLDIVSNKRAWCQRKFGLHYNWAIIGSSRSFGSFDMISLQKVSKKEIINLGANGSGYLDNYLILYQFLKNQNTIDTLFIQTDIYALNSKESFSNAFHAFNFIPFTNDPEIKRELFEQLTPQTKALWTIFPSIRYFQYNKYFSPKEIARRYKFKNIVKSPFDKTLGGSSKKEFRNFNSGNNSKQFETLNNEDLRYFFKIIEMCKKNKIEIVAYTAPEYEKHKQQIKNHMRLTKKIEELLREQNIDIVKPDSTFEANQYNFFDPLHLSDQGQTTFTSLFFNNLKAKNAIQLD